MDGPPFGLKTLSETKRKYLRFRTKPLHDLRLHLNDDSPNLGIANISLGGIGILSAGLEELENEFAATLTIGKEIFNIQLEKRFQDDEIMGCQFQNPSPELQECIGKYFQTELLASTLNRVESLPTQKNGQDKIIFFHGPNNCELLINERNGQICHFSIVVLGNCIEVDPKGVLVIGQSINDAKVPSRNGLILFRSVAKPERHILEVAIRFIDNIGDLTPEYRKNLIQIIQSLSAKHEAKNGT